MVWRLLCVCVSQVAGQWLDAALRSLPTQRADGVVTVTENQIIKFQQAVRSGDRLDSRKQNLFRS